MSILAFVERSVISDNKQLSLSEKYEPTCSSQMIGRISERDTLISYFNAFLSAPRVNPKKHAHKPVLPRFAMLSGPSGTGKTLLCKLVAKELGLHVFEVNQLNARNKKELFDAMDMCVAASDRAVVVIDEYDFIDSLSLSETRNLLDGFYRNPFVLITSRHTHGKTFDLSKEACLISFGETDRSDIVRWIRRIMRAENMDANYANLVASMTSTDFRFILKWLELNRASKLTPSMFESETFQKDDEVDCISATRLLLCSKEPLTVRKALNIASHDVNLLSSMVSENYMSVASLDTSIDVIADCAELISMADEMECFIYSRQVWDMWECFSMCSTVYPAMRIRQTCDTDAQLSFTKMWSRISNMYYRIYQLDDVCKCLQKAGLSHDSDTIIYMGTYYYNMISNGDITKCVKDLSTIGMNTDNVNMLLKQGNILRYKGTLQKKIKKEFDKQKTPSNTKETKRRKASAS